jgi:GT2 family glycosyltransferase
MPRVSVAVLNYNGRELLEATMPSLLEQDYRDYEVIVVDDASSDDSLAYLSAHWPQVRAVSAGEGNVGVAAALNAGVAAATGELVALLNNDIELDPGWLGELVAALDRHPEAASVAGKLLRFDRREQIDAAGDIFTRSGSAFGRGSGERDRGQFEREEEIFAPTAGAALYRASALADVGPFDESFFAYFEDVDWGLRARLAGYRAWYVPGAVGYHMGSATTRPRSNPRFYALQRRNTIAVLVKDVPLRFIARNAHRILAAHAVSLAYSARAGMLGTHLRAYLAAARELPRWLEDRRTILGGRRIPLEEFDRFVSDRRS